MNDAMKMAAEIGKLRAGEVVRNELVRQQFINVYNAIWKEGGESVYEREANHFQHLMRDSEKLKSCTPISVFFAFIDLAVQGITLEPGVRAMAYLLPRNYKAQAPDGRTVWETRCNLTVSGYGELFLRARAGQILHADNPVIVYEGDEFSFGERDGRKFVSFMSRIPRQSNRIIACFMKITRIDGSTDYAVMTEADWVRLSGYSAKNNAYTDRSGQRVEKPNELYTSNDGSIDPSFLAAKCIKHAFKSYPKLNIGRGTQLETSVAGQPQDDLDPYAGIPDTPAQPAGFPPQAPGVDSQTPAPKPDDFCPPRQPSAGVTVQPAADDDEAF
jgi:hypothetical protein